MSRTFLAILHFDGGEFVGWQRQKTGRTVQGTVEAAMERLTGAHRTVHGAGRTDAGVHAEGMGISFEVPERWSSEELHRALNALLPGDCWIESVRRMRDGFHARKSAEARDYRYDVGCDAASRSPFRHRFEWALGRTLEVDRLQAAAANLVGEHDFTAFAVRGTAQPHARCRIRRALWEPRDGLGVRFRITADRFLHHMVRMLVGTMVDIGLGRRDPDDMRILLDARDNSATSPPAPPQGLYFVAAEYAADWYREPAS